MPVHRAGCAARAPSWGIFTRREDPFSFPKAEGTDASVDLGITSQDEERGSRGKKGQCAEAGPGNSGGNEGLFLGHVKVPR